MIQAEQCFFDCINSPIRHVLARVEQYSGSTLVNTFAYDDYLKEFTIERIGEGKFFGYGVSQKVNVTLIDMYNEIEIDTTHRLEIVFGTNCDYIYTFPTFYVTEVNRNTKTKEISITAYDALYNSNMFTVSDFVLAYPHTIEDFARACASVLGLPFGIENVNDGIFSLSYERGVNFSGSESIRDALNAIAEATQTIYYINHDWQLTFKRLSRDTSPVATIDKAKYFSLNSKTNRRLSEIQHVTELNDNTFAATGLTGTTQYIRDNAFYNTRDDIQTLLDNAIVSIGDLTINQFECDWRGNYLIEIGDKIGLEIANGVIVESFLLNDTISYNGALTQHTEWSYTADENVTDQPATVSDSIRLTYTKVDKINNQIDLITSDINTNSEQISYLQLTSESITASVGEIESNVNESLETINSDIVELSNEVAATMTAEEVVLEVQTQLSNGVDKVVTSTGYTFDDTGLTISKTGSEMETTITDNGMTVYRDSEAVLVADHEGVKAEDLQATTYLIIGGKVRFESYGDNRVGCFWIGG